VLLVEDDDAYAGFLRAALSIGDEPPDLRRAGDLAAALASVGRVELDAVLLDLNLPDSRGVDTLRAVVAVAPHLPVVVLTGVSDTALARDALQLGAQDWVSKDHLDPELVQRAVRYAVERKQLTDRLVQAQKLEIAGRLANGVAHEFNNVLTAIAGSAHLVEEAEDAEARRHALDLLRRAARQGVALSRQLLSLARNPPINDEVVDVGALIEQTRLLVQAVLPSSIALEIGPVESVLVRIDPGQFDQLLLNLVINARDAMPDGGTLRIGVTAERRPPEPRRPPGSADHLQAIVRVRDTGRGIDPEIQARLFEPFFSTKGPGGTGLGLAVVAEIVERFAGAVEVDSGVGRGTTFTVTLPAVEPAGEWS
jgi:two-component system, cell cycle sensor histidine kinase and response regulator CckA